MSHEPVSSVGARRTACSARVVLVALVALLVPGVCAAEAPPPLDVTTLAGGASLREHLTAYLDPTGTVTLDALRAAPPRPAKLPSDADLSFGLTRATLWLCFDLINTGSDPRKLVLELGYPPLDFVTLTVLHADGRREQHTTGDALPFAQREAGDAAFVFRLEAGAHTRASYYLKLQTSGILKVPLRLWQPDAYTEHARHHDRGLWIFYGVLLMLVLTSIGVWLMTRLDEYIAHACMLLALSGVVAALNGHAFQYLLPTHPALANRVLPLSLAVVIASAARLAQHIVASAPALARDLRLIGYWFPISTLLALFSCVSEPGLGLRVMLVVVVVGLAHSLTQLVRLARVRDPQVRVYMLSWVPLMLAMPVQLLRYLNYLPQSLLTDFSAHIAIGVHGITTSLALASRVNFMRAGLRSLNDQLLSNVTALEVALARAEQASEQARRATLAKDEFVATMSHELRTPLNAIINVPVGLLDDFVQQRVARCDACQTRFLLEPGEQLDGDVLCAECGERGTLEAFVETHYQGDAARTAHFLRRIERSGRHLLQMVNGVLDFSKLEAGHLALEPMLIDLGQVLRDVVEEMTDIAAKKQQRIALTLATSTLPTVADPTRVKQILINLLANASKFSEPGSLITVRWQALPEADLIAVHDQGIGIAPADQGRVFLRFEQVHQGDTRKYGGTGLGLPISRSLARMHGGDLTVQSKLGEGAIFTVSLPRRSAKRSSVQGIDTAR